MGGENRRTVDTFARLLAGFERRDEAIAIAKTALGTAQTPPERELMEACLDYCRNRADG